MSLRADNTVLRAEFNAAEAISFRIPGLNPCECRVAV